MWASDPELKSTVGDLVIIDKLEEPQSDRVTHFVKSTPFPVGRTVDPVTGQKCRGPDFLDNENRQILQNQNS